MGIKFGGSFRVKIVSPKTKLQFEEYYDLRWRILSKPLKQPRGSEIDDDESKCIHRMIVDENGNVIGIGRLQFNSKTEAQIRWMAIEEKFQNISLGTKLIRDLETIAKERGAKTMVLQAREIALEFYYKLGYSLIEKSHLIFDSVQHYKLQKKLINC